MSVVLITGVAGFIGYHTALALSSGGHRVTGVDNVNDYYDPALKNARLDALSALPNIEVRRADIANCSFWTEFEKEGGRVDYIIHLAAQAGVRYSLVNPHVYGESNLTGHLNVLEFARRAWSGGDIKTASVDGTDNKSGSRKEQRNTHKNGLRHLVYASSSSVYGANRKLPFSVSDRTDYPVSLYAATKKAGEVMAQSYAHLYRIPITGLRFFTVYGPWGRPDMAYYIFTKALYEGTTLKLYNNGDMGRDFTYIDDIVSGMIAVMKARPEPGDEGTIAGAPHRILNLGNSRPERLGKFLSILEELTGRKAQVEYEVIQPGDVKETFADVGLTTRIAGYQPATTLREGLEEFVRWYKDYHEIS